MLCPSVAPVWFRNCEPFVSWFTVLIQLPPETGEELVLYFDVGLVH
jgi:hypothetical protein